jgi:hypothetical protein
MRDVAPTDRERRRNPRNTVLQRAHIVLPHPELPIECTVRNLSGSGALLRVSDAVKLQPTFSLLLSGTDLRSCVIARRDGREVAIHFAPGSCARLQPGASSPSLTVRHFTT